MTEQSERPPEHTGPPAVEPTAGVDAPAPDHQAETSHVDEVRALVRDVIAESGPLLRRLAE